MESVSYSCSKRAEYRIWTSRSTNQLWFCGEEFAVTACSVWCGSVLLNSGLNFSLSLPTTHFLQPLLLSLWSTSLSSLLPQLSTSHHTVCYVANGLYFITDAAEIVARCVKTAELLLSVRQAPLCAGYKYNVWCYERTLVHVVFAICLGEFKCVQCEHSI